VTLGNASGDDITVTGSLASNLIPNADGSFTLGNSSFGFVSLSLENGATDGGAVYFNSGTTAFLKATADGTRLDTGGFTTLRASACAIEVLNTNTKAKIDASGVIEYAGANSPLWMSNIGIFNDTTSETNDSISIKDAGGASFSTSNPGHIALGAVTPGQLLDFIVVADVTIDLTGAHWGMGTKGDFNDVKLYVYAINDTSAIKFGVALESGLVTVSDSTSSATGSSVNTSTEMLVNTTLNSGTWACRCIGWVNANFDDTGGASEDLWAVQTDVGDISVGVPVAFGAVRDNSQIVLDTPNGHGSSSTKIRRFTNSVITGASLTYADSATAGMTVTVNRRGTYFIASIDKKAAGAGEHGISIDSSELTTSCKSIIAADRVAINVAVSGEPGYCGSVIQLDPGQVIRAHTAGDVDATDAYCEFRVTRIGD